MEGCKSCWFIDGRLKIVGMPTPTDDKGDTMEVVGTDDTLTGDEPCGVLLQNNTSWNDKKFVLV